MKNKLCKRGSLFVSLWLAVGWMMSASFGETWYWDANGTNAGFGTNIAGNWATSAFWSTNADGMGPTFLWSVGSGRDIVFNASDCPAPTSEVERVIFAPKELFNKINSSNNMIRSIIVHYSGTQSNTVYVQGDSSSNPESERNTFLTLMGEGVFDIENGVNDTDFKLAMQVAGSVGVTKRGTGKVYRNRNNDTYTGPTRIEKGNYRIANSDTIPNTSPIIIGNGAELGLDGGPNGLNETVGSIAGNGQIRLEGTDKIFVCGGDNTSTEFSGTILSQTNAAGGLFVKEGTGALTLSGTNTYGESTIVSNGTLFVKGAYVGHQDNGIGTTTVASSGVLGGTGTIKGTVTVQSNGTLLATNFRDNLTVENLVLATHAQIRCEYNDRLIITGNATISGKWILTGDWSAASSTYQLYTVGGAVTDNGLTLDTSQVTPAEFTWTLNPTTGVLSRGKSLGLFLIQ